MLIGDLMERKVTTCRPEDSLSRAAKLMWASDCGTLPVVDGGGRIVAILTAAAARTYQEMASSARPARSKWPAICPLTASRSCSWSRSRAAARTRWLWRRVAGLSASYAASRILPWLKS